MRNPLASFIHRTTLGNQLSVAVAVGILFLALCSSLVSSWYGGRRIRDNLVEQGLRIAENLASQSELALLYASAENGNEAVAVTLSFPDITRVEIRDAAGRVLLLKGSHSALAQQDAPAIKERALQSKRPFLERELDDAWQFVAPVSSGSAQSPFDLQDRRAAVLGYVRVSESKDSLTRMKRDVFIANFGIAFFFAMLFLLALRWFARHLTRPLDVLADAMSGAEHGETGPQPDPHAGPSDIARMAQAFNSMMAAMNEKTAAIERYRDQLEQLVAARTAELSEANASLIKSKRELEDTHTQLLQSEKLASIGQLAAGVAHEINNPIGFVNSNLGTLGGYLEDLLRLLDAYEQQGVLLRQQSTAYAAIEVLREEVDVEYLKQDLPVLLAESKDGLNRVKKIVLDLKEFSHIGASDWEYANVHRCIDSALNMVWNELRYKTELVKEYGELPDIECLPSELNQVFLNLLVNAGHAISERGTITIRTGRKDDQVWIEIADSGSGIKPEHLQRVFDPFFTTKAVGQGTGLGLSLSYGIIKRHHGLIEVDSMLQRGTTFRITLPLVQPD